MLTLPDLEAVYEHLAQAIDAAPTGQSELLLVKFALLAAQDIGSAARVSELLAAAATDLDAP